MGAHELLSFPNPVNEKAARTVAAGVLAMSVATLALSLSAGTGWLWLTAVLAAGFIARALAGPRFSPLGRLATQVLAPRLGSAKLVPGPPKRFAQSIGATLSTVAVVLLAAGLSGGSQVLLGLLIVASGLESIGGLCLGCAAFGWLMAKGVIPEETCLACANISLRSA